MNPAAPPNPPTLLPPPRQRLDSIDFVRGLAIIVMAADHTRGAFGGANFDPLDLTAAGGGPEWFLSRWITHYCAPTFVLLAGLGASLRAQGRPWADTAGFLATRGLWLMVLEHTLVHFGMGWTLGFDWLSCMVIWAIGAAMVLLAFAAAAPRWVVGLIGAALVASHNLADYYPKETLDSLGPAWALLVQRGRFELGPVKVGVMYPILPWAGVMFLGYALGALYTWRRATRLATLAALGIAAVLAFSALRYNGLYGDPRPWKAEMHPLKLLDCCKYPPSLHYDLMTLGPALLLLAAAESFAHFRWLRPVVVFGRVPLFFYLLHWPLINGSTRLWQYGAAEWGWVIPVDLLSDSPNLTRAWAAWAAVILLLYPACYWFAALRKRYNWWWLSYL